MDEKVEALVEVEVLDVQLERVYSSRLFCRRGQPQPLLHVYPEGRSGDEEDKRQRDERNWHRESGIPIESAECKPIAHLLFFWAN